MATLVRALLIIVAAAPLSAQEIQPKLVLSGHTGSVRDVAFSPDGKRLATTGFSDRTLVIWDATTGKALKKRVFPKHTHPEELAFTPNGKALVLSYSHPVPRVVSFAPGGFDTIEILDLSTGAERVIVKVEDPGGLEDLRFTPDGRTLAILAITPGKERNGDFDGSIFLWDVGAAKMRDRITMRGLPLRRDLQFSPNGSTLASVARGGVALLDTSSWKIRATLNDPKVSPWSLSFSPDGKWLASCGSPSDVEIWDMSDNSLSRTIGELPGAGRVAFAPDGTMLMVAGGDGRLHFLDAATFDRRVSIAIHRGGCAQIDFSPDGKLILTAYGDGKVQLWETAAFQRLLEAGKSQTGGKRATARRPEPAARGPRVEFQRGKPLTTQAVRNRLDRPTTMRFTKGIPLERFVAEVARATREPPDAGVPVHIDPLGLIVADRALDTPVTVDADRVPLKQLLSRALTSLGLGHWVVDGVLVITAPGELEDLPDGPFPTRDSTPQTKAILALLRRPVALDYPDLTPLAEVLADVRQAVRTTGANLPIHVSPKGLENADKTAASPVTITLQGASLGTSLRLLLAELGMGYYIADGALVVTDRQTADAGGEKRGRGRKRGQE